MFLKNRNFISKIKRSKVTDYAALRNNSIGHGFIYNFKDPIHLCNFKSEFYIALQFYIKTSKVISNVFYYISKVIVIVIITFLQVL